MIEINRKEDCCGCGACAQICPKSCITMSSDNEGFLYPNVDLSICVNCGLCEKVCNIRHPKDVREPLRVLAAINKNDEVRMKSSSGGIFYILAEYAINKGGVVFGARFDENWQVVLDYSETLEGVKPFMGSKYVQARVENAYKDAKRFLDSGRFVLFSGTPCQISGLHSFLRKEYPNLLTVDLVCHGVPSPKVWGMYIGEVKTLMQSNGCVGPHAIVRNLRDCGFIPTYNNEDKCLSLASSASKNPYMKAFLQNLILRPSCYDCKAKAGRSQCDITLADFWGIDSVHPELDDDKGTSMVLVNTANGAEIMKSLGNKIWSTLYKGGRLFNPSYYCSSVSHPQRMDFFVELSCTNDVVSLLKYYTKQTFGQWCRSELSDFKHLLVGMVTRRNYGENRISIEKIKHFSELQLNVEIDEIRFRDKRTGWKTYSVAIETGSKANKTIL